MSRAKKGGGDLLAPISWGWVKSPLTDGHYPLLSWVIHVWALGRPHHVSRLNKKSPGSGGERHTAWTWGVQASGLGCAFMKLVATSGDRLKANSREPGGAKRI